eukprot:477522-Pyramimonas_sp.AAC.1
MQHTQSPESSGVTRVRDNSGSFFGNPNPSYPGPELSRITRAPNIPTPAGAGASECYHEAGS